jgi:putative ABC transport system permease protein
MLGIIIGVGSVVLMTSIGGSVEQLILGQVSSLGAKSMVIFPGQEQPGDPASQAGRTSLTFDDVRALEHLTTIKTVAPVIFIPQEASKGGEVARPEISGVTPEFFENQSIEAARGRLLEKSDNEGAKFVAVLGPDTAKDLFGTQDPIGEHINIGDRSFLVVGVTKPLGSQFFQNADARVYVPFSVARVLTGQQFVNYITLQAAGDIDLAFADIRSLLRSRHKIENPENDEQKDDFVVHSAEQALDILGTVSFALTMLLSTIASISLVVGGIGIMNIMLVAVTERTREIGLRKAVGARKRDILLQFLLEAVLLTVIGGIIGIIVGLLFAFVGSLIAGQFLTNYAFTVSMPSIALAVGVAAGVGLLFGVYPARRAANLRPIEALRYE